MELKIKELRIGNWYSVNGFGKDGQYKRLRLTDYDKISRGLIKPYGIELTEEWLERFGIKIDEWFGNFKLSKEDNIYYLQGSNTFTNVVITLTELKYVHQLQNLYFSLVREELEIKKD